MTAESQQLNGRVALVTGASRGIGRAIAQRFAAEGATVVVTARSLQYSTSEPGTLKETVELIEQAGGRAIALAADLEIAAEREQLIPRVLEIAGGLDILVNNAGYAEYACVEDMPASMFDRTLEHYLRIPFLLNQAAIAPMRARGGGWILNLGSVTALPPMLPYNEFDRAGGVAVYAAAKAAVNRFTQGLAAELLKDNIAVNSVGPSTAIATPGGSRYIPADFPTEPVEYLVETALALCTRPASERTGLVTHSLHFPLAHRLAVFSLDGREPLPAPELPAWAHPEIRPEGR